jgi:DNA mismatch repair protein MutH
MSNPNDSPIHQVITVRRRIKRGKKGQRPTLQEVADKAEQFINLRIHVPKKINKGNAGQLFEKLTGIPTSSACLDCLDGEVKTFPIKQLKRSGEYVPKETIALTMITNESLTDHTFQDSRCSKKVSRVLYVPYWRDQDCIVFLKPTLIDLHEEQFIPLLNVFQHDYELARLNFTTQGSFDGSSKIGKYIQTRTKGAGKLAPKRRAFYLRTGFIREYVPIHDASLP